MDPARDYTVKSTRPCIDHFYRLLKQSKTVILYAANIDPVALGKAQNRSTDLNITDNASMTKMDSLIKYLGGKNTDYAGIDRPTIYVGAEGSLFQCYREDVSLQAINMHVAGSPKIWFVVPPKYYQAFCNFLMKLGLSVSERLCSSIIQHKSFFVDPRAVIAEGIPVHTIVQRPGEIVYLLPNAVHWGFNVGWNVNEAVNCASKTYANFGMLSAQRCQCESVRHYKHKFDISRILREA
ncbi:Lysine-specific demethylase 4D [Frankliniella fusca]|uniref:Lysine-specific demethylase 4D n=1 Tax=Frankliniella fusca TaxID=407009 RepID=A0AAE1HWI7_9NEOP|nr:Lysine-specific demethylase 4D [Frankliniella fusca]